MIKFPKIGGFSTAARSHAKMLEYCPEKNPVVQYQATVKLHGTNAGVVCLPDRLVPQSRNRELSVGSDHFGFAAFIAREEVQTAIRKIEEGLRNTATWPQPEHPGLCPLVIFGELVGPGIQKKVALSQLPRRQWVIFAAAFQVGEELHFVGEFPPLGLECSALDIYSISEVPPRPLVMDFSDLQLMEILLETFALWVSEVDACCPWGKLFGIEGVGEGWVFSPVGLDVDNRDLAWKAKGKSHEKNSKGFRSKAVDPELAKSVRDFVERAVTEARLEQGVDYLREMLLPVEITSMGDFLRWVANDVIAECSTDLVESGLEWKQVAKHVNALAASYFKKVVR